MFATSAQLRAAVELRQSDLAMAQKDLARRERLGNSGAISTEELQHARDSVRSAEAALMSAQQQLAGNQARVDGTTLENHPDVRNASAAVRSAYLTYSRTILPAPVSGFVARRAVQLGQRVGPGCAVDVGGTARPGLGGRELQGAAVGQHAGRAACDPHGGPVRRRLPLSWQDCWIRRRHGLGICAPSSSECHRQLDQDRAAGTRAHCPRSAGDGRASIADRIVNEGRGVGSRWGWGAVAAVGSQCAGVFDRCIPLGRRGLPIHGSRKSLPPTIRSMPKVMGRRSRQWVNWRA